MKTLGLKILAGNLASPCPRECIRFLWLLGLVPQDSCISVHYNLLEFPEEKHTRHEQFSYPNRLRCRLHPKRQAAEEGVKLRVQA
jgi:hypothetical protein